MTLLVSLAPTLHVLQTQGHTSLPLTGLHDPAGGHGPKGHKSWKLGRHTAASKRAPASAAETLAFLPGMRKSRKVRPGTTSTRRQCIFVPGVRRRLRPPGALRFRAFTAAPSAVRNAAEGAAVAHC